MQVHKESCAGASILIRPASCIHRDNSSLCNIVSYLCNCFIYTGMKQKQEATFQVASQNLTCSGEAEEESDEKCTVHSLPAEESLDFLSLV